MRTERLSPAGPKANSSPPGGAIEAGFAKDHQVADVITIYREWERVISLARPAKGVEGAASARSTTNPRPWTWPLLAGAPFEIAEQLGGAVTP